jgi:hypothetical protein
MAFSVSRREWLIVMFVVQTRLRETITRPDGRNRVWVRARRESLAFLREDRLFAPGES